MVVTTFEISGFNEPARIRFAISKSLVDVAVTAEYEGLCATWNVPMNSADIDAFLDYFRDLSQNSEGWEGYKTVSSIRNNELVLMSSYRSYFAPDRVDCVDFSLTLASDFQDPYWKVEIRLELLPESLPDIAEHATQFFSDLQYHLDSD